MGTQRRASGSAHCGDRGLCSRLSTYSGQNYLQFCPYFLSHLCLCTMSNIFFMDKGLQEERRDFSPLTLVYFGYFCVLGFCNIVLGVSTGCGGLLFGTDCVWRWQWFALLCVTAAFGSTWSLHVLKTLTNFLQSQSLPLFIVGGPSVKH